MKTFLLFCFLSFEFLFKFHFEMSSLKKRDKDFDILDGRGSDLNEWRKLQRRAPMIPIYRTNLFWGGVILLMLSPLGTPCPAGTIETNKGGTEITVTSVFL